MRRTNWLVGLGLLCAVLPGCATPGAAPPDPAVVAAHEWYHGPPWGPEELPWVAPPTIVLAGSPYYSPYYYGVGAGLGFGFSRGAFRGHRGHFHGMSRGGGHRGGGRGGRR
jgi:hypothetical protein